MPTPQVEIVNSMATCERALQHLRREPYLAVDGEGVNLSRTGPLTLLQVGTRYGKVYLFDVLAEPKILKTEWLASILESDVIVKVMHSSKNDGEALYWQFKVRLQNVFDTQVAQMELQRAEGRHLPSRMKLAEVCALYCPQKASLLEEDKNQIQRHWCKSEGEYWAKRPLTREMINYASLDVIVLIPEVYRKMRSLVESKGLTQQVNERIREDIAATTDSELSVQPDQKDEEITLSILRKFARSAPQPRRLADIADEDVLSALKRLKFGHLKKDGLPSNIGDLKVQITAETIKEIETELQEKGDNIVPSRHMFGVLYTTIYHAEDEALKEKAQNIKHQLEKIVIQDMARKYTQKTPIVHLAFFEKQVLDRVLHPKGENDPSVNRVVLRLYWLHQEEKVDDNIRRFTDSPSDYHVSDGYAKKLRFFISGQGVPQTLKTKARNFLDRLEAAGKVARPPRRR